MLNYYQKASLFVCLLLMMGGTGESFLSGRTGDSKLSGRTAPIRTDYQFQTLLRVTLAEDSSSVPISLKPLSKGNEIAVVACG